MNITPNSVNTNNLSFRGSVRINAEDKYSVGLELGQNFQRAAHWAHEDLLDDWNDSVLLIEKKPKKFIEEQEGKKQVQPISVYLDRRPDKKKEIIISDQSDLELKKELIEAFNKLKNPKKKANPANTIANLQKGDIIAWSQLPAKRLIGLFTNRSKITHVGVMIDDTTVQDIKFRTSPEKDINIFWDEDGGIKRTLKKIAMTIALNVVKLSSDNDGEGDGDARRIQITDVINKDSGTSKKKDRKLYVCKLSEKARNKIKDNQAAFDIYMEEAMNFKYDLKSFLDYPWNENADLYPFKKVKYKDPEKEITDHMCNLDAEENKEKTNQRKTKRRRSMCSVLSTKVMHKSKALPKSITPEGTNPGELLAYGIYTNLLERITRIQ